jgi:UDP-glucose 4-epimerase
MSRTTAFSPPRVLVTGATGLIGRQLLVAAPAPFVLRAALRSSGALTPTADMTVVGNIDASTDWTLALEGVTHVIHLAARVHVMHPTDADRAAFEQTNVLGTERLARAAAQSGVERFVFLSSIKVNGERTRGSPFTPDDVPAPADDYGRSKLEAERRLTRIAAESPMSVAIVRPPLVYGPGVQANFLRLLGFAERAVPLPLASVQNARSLVSVWNLCDLIWALLTRPSPARGVFLVDDGRPISTPELIRALARAMGRPVRLFPMPRGALRWLATLSGHAGEFERLCESLLIDSSATRAQVPWTPPLTLQQGLERTARWYLDP